jgi:hypothetical protein
LRGCFEIAAAKFVQRDTPAGHAGTGTDWEWNAMD